MTTATETRPKTAKDFAERAQARLTIKHRRLDDLLRRAVALEIEYSDRLKKHATDNDWTYSGDLGRIIESLDSAIESLEWVDSSSIGAK